MCICGGSWKPCTLRSVCAASSPRVAAPASALSLALKSSKEYKNVALAYASQGDSQISASVGSASGLARREIAVSTSVDQDTSNKTAVLKQKANEELADHKIQKKFEGEVDSTMLYVYGRDYFLGDIVQLSNEYGQEGAARVDEMVFSFDTSYGATRLPTFTSIDEEE